MISRPKPEPRTALPATAILVAASITSAGLGYLWTIITGRLLTAEEYADFSAAASIVYFAATALAPCAQTMAYFTASYVAAGDLDSASALERRALRFVAVGGIAAIIIAAASSPMAAALHFRSRLSLLLAVVSAAGVGAIHIKRGRLLGQQQFGRYSWNITVESIIRLVLAVLLLLLAASATASLGAYALALLAALALAPWQKAGALRDVDMVAVRRYFAPVFAYTIIYAGFQNIDVLVVKRLFPPAEAGMYGAASLLSRAAGMLVMPFVAFAVPHLVEVLDDAAEVRRRFTRIVAQYSVLAAAAVAVFGLGGRVIISVLFGAEYRPAANLLLPLSAAIALSGLVFLLCQLPVARNRFGFVRWYAVALVIEVAGLAMFHRKLLDIPLVLIATNLIALLLVIPHLRTRVGNRSA